MNDSIVEFYTDLTPLYHLIHGDWEKSILDQADALDSIIRERWGTGTKEILDVACGIGTQSLGLAQKGYQVTASDLTSESVKRARREASNRALDITFSVADMRSVHDHHDREFDLVLAGDNAVPHLLGDTQILQAFRQFYACTRPGGGCLISVRDYNSESITRPVNIDFFGIRKHGQITYEVFQKWDWDGDQYDLSMYFVENNGTASCTTHVMRSRYYAISIERLIELMELAGYCEVERLDQRFFQPVIAGTKR